MQLWVRVETPRCVFALCWLVKCTNSVTYNGIREKLNHWSKYKRRDWGYVDTHFYHLFECCFKIAPRDSETCRILANFATWRQEPCRWKSCSQSLLRMSPSLTGCPGKIWKYRTRVGAKRHTEEDPKLKLTLRTQVAGGRGETRRVSVNRERKWI